jgi:hypothetical protein
MQALRTPVPIEREDVDEILAVLAEGVEDADLPRIRPVAFEQWYRKYFDEFEDIDDVA